jgi:hypothetical protein
VVAIALTFLMAIIVTLTSANAVAAPADAPGVQIGILR